MTDKRVKDLVAGDETEYYKVRNVTVSPTQVIAEVQHIPDGGIGERVWDNPDHILTVKDKLFQLEWGLSPQREVAIAYGARAIYNGPGTCDIVWDRQSCEGGTPEQRKEMCKWINEYGLPEIKKITQKEGLYGSDDRRVSFQLHDWFVMINPRGSCGYLYIGIHPVDGGDPSFFPAPVPSPAPAKKPGVKKARRR